MTAYKKKMLVLGIGNPNCGDDAAGPTVAERIKNLDLNNLHSLSVPGEPSTIITALKGYNYVVVVDAILSQNATGTLHVFDASQGALPTGLFGHFSTHSFGLSDSIELARALGELPTKIIVLGIEGEHFEPGDEMSPRVNKAIEDATQWIIERSATYSPVGHKSSTLK